MVTLTRITGVLFALNPDLIERVDQTPDTVITLVDGTKYLVRDSLAEVVAIVLAFRAEVLAACARLEATDDSSARRGRLTAVPGTSGEHGQDPEGHAEPGTLVAAFPPQGS